MKRAVLGGVRFGFMALLLAAHGTVFWAAGGASQVVAQEGAQPDQGSSDPEGAASGEHGPVLDRIPELREPGQIGHERPYALGGQRIFEYFGEPIVAPSVPSLAEVLEPERAGVPQFSSVVPVLLLSEGAVSLLVDLIFVSTMQLARLSVDLSNAMLFPDSPLPDPTISLEEYKAMERDAFLKAYEAVFGKEFAEFMATIEKSSPFPELF